MAEKIITKIGRNKGTFKYYAPFTFLFVIIHFLLIRMVSASISAVGPRSLSVYASRDLKELMIMWLSPAALFGGAHLCTVIFLLIEEKRKKTNFNLTLYTLLVLLQVLPYTFMVLNAHGNFDIEQKMLRNPLL